MRKIEISAIKNFRESIGATHVVVFAVDEDGVQSVATHGRTEKDAKEAAAAGNKLKASLGWPAGLCNSSPLERICKNCAFYKPDYGIHCFNGWTGDGSSGDCQYQPGGKIKTSAKDKCSVFEPKA